MKTRKILSAALTVPMALTLLAGCGVNFDSLSEKAAKALDEAGFEEYNVKDLPEHEEDEWLDGIYYINDKKKYNDELEYTLDFATISFIDSDVREDIADEAVQYLCGTKIYDVDGDDAVISITVIEFESEDDAADCYDDLIENIEEAADENDFEINDDEDNIWMCATEDGDEDGKALGHIYVSLEGNCIMVVGGCVYTDNNRYYKSYNSDVEDLYENLDVQSPLDLI